MVPTQLFVYAVVSSISIPCVATLAALRAELGTRAPRLDLARSLGLALGLGMVLARVLGIA